MTTPLSERDLIQLNAYLDGELDAAERAAVERRLAVEPALSEELAGLRMTAALLGMAERVRAPRSFTLDPAVYGRPARPSIWDRLGLPRTAALAGAGAMLVTVALCLGTMILANFQPGQGGVAMAPAADTAAEPAIMAEEAAGAEMEAFEAPEEAVEALEAPAEEPAAEEDADEGMADAAPAEESEAAAAGMAAPEPTPTETSLPPVPTAPAVAEEPPVEPPMGAARSADDEAAAADGEAVMQTAPKEPVEAPARVTLLMVVIAVAAGLLGAALTIAGLALRQRR